MSISRNSKQSVPKSAQKRAKSRPKGNQAAETAISPLLQDEFPIAQMAPGDVLALQRTIGNQRTRQLLARRAALSRPLGTRPVLQRHSTQEAPPVPDEEEIQAKRLPGPLLPARHRNGVQRHSTQEAPPVPDEEELQAKSLVQRRPVAHGSLAPRTKRPSRLPVSKASPFFVQRLEMKESDLGAGGIEAGGFWYNGDLRDKVRRYHGGVAASTPAGHKLLLEAIIASCDQFDTQEEEAVKKNAWMEKDKGRRLATVEKLREEAKKELAALNDYTEFIKQPYDLENHTVGLNGKFDVKYEPSKKLANIIVKVKFSFPEDTGTITEEQKQKQKEYRDNYHDIIKNSWSGKYQFKMAREPQVVWGRLTPTTVVVKTEEVDSGQHFTIEARPTTEGGAVVGGGVTKLWKGDEAPVEMFNPVTATGELKRVERIIPEVKFANNSIAVDNTYHASLEFLATYLKRINNPKFKLEIVGHASKTGKSEGNQTLSEQRAKAVRDFLEGKGLTNHTLEDSGVGDAGATPDSAWRKVEIKHSLEDPGWKNKQAVTPHEFGHMIGLGDEYAGASPNATHYDLVKKALGEKYADQVAKRGDTDYASIMEGGDDIRIQHYVTFWDALVKTVETKATVPDPKLSHDDWKFIG